MLPVSSAALTTALVDWVMSQARLRLHPTIGFHIAFSATIKSCNLPPRINFRVGLVQMSCGLDPKRES